MMPALRSSTQPSPRFGQGRLLAAAATAIVAAAVLASIEPSAHAAVTSTVTEHASAPAAWPLW
jgi:hypothetical protein